MTTKKGNPERACVKLVTDPFSFRGRKCGKPGKVEVNGEWYCGIHDPVKRKAKRDARLREICDGLKIRRARSAIDFAIADLGRLAVEHRDLMPDEFKAALVEYDAANKRLAEAGKRGDS